MSPRYDSRLICEPSRALGNANKGATFSGGEGSGVGVAVEVGSGVGVDAGSGVGVAVGSGVGVAVGSGVAVAAGAAGWGAPGSAVGASDGDGWTGVASGSRVASASGVSTGVGHTDVGAGTGVFVGSGVAGTGVETAIAVVEGDTVAGLSWVVTICEVAVGSCVAGAGEVGSKVAESPPQAAMASDARVRTSTQPSLIVMF